MADLPWKNAMLTDFGNSLSRRGLLGSLTAGVAGAGHAAQTRQPPEHSLLADLSREPDNVFLQTESTSENLERHRDEWNRGDVVVRIEGHESSHGPQRTVRIRSPKTAPHRLRLRWLGPTASGLSYLGDAWERSYGDLGWRPLEPERILPWHFFAASGTQIAACGVKTNPSAFCFWQIDPDGVSLWLDLRNGGTGVQLGKRELVAATIVQASYRNVSPFNAARQFCRALCDRRRMPASPVYGGNNWYYAYGKSSADDIRSDSERIASWAPKTGANQPFMVIDDGWQPNATAGPWDRGAPQFPDMAKLAADMRRIGVRAGIWTRPLFTKENVPESWRLQSPNARTQFDEHRGVTLDPTIPAVRRRVEEDMRRLAGWGYELIKHDFSTFDLMGRWGFTMDAAITDAGWSFADRSRTNAEIIRSLYEAIREGAGDVMITGCNTVGHLSAGLFEMQRTGDDTSGRDWNRTRKMGVNTLAFRAPQHGAFFAVDADCVGLTNQVPWKYNRQWLDLLARAGVPLFVSAAPNAVESEQRSAIRAAFETASIAQPLGEPLDWNNNTEPEHWRLQGKVVAYDWFGADGVSPFAG
jgi:alpha-galactosidase